MAADDTRFVLPTEQTLPKLIQSEQNQQQQSQSNKIGADVLYAETNFVNASDTQPNTEEHELETRLKYVFLFPFFQIIYCINFFLLQFSYFLFFMCVFRLLIHCHDKEYESQTVQRGDFWVLKNYIRADHGELRCFQSVTYTTHADYTFLDNLIPLLER